MISPSIADWRMCDFVDLDPAFVLLGINLVQSVIWRSSAQSKNKMKNRQQWDTRGWIRCSPGQGSLCKHLCVFNTKKTMHLRLTFFLNKKSRHWHTSWNFMATWSGNVWQKLPPLCLCGRCVFYVCVCVVIMILCGKKILGSISLSLFLPSLPLKGNVICSSR